MLVANQASEHLRIWMGYSQLQYHRQFAHSTIMNVFLCLLVFPEVMWMQLLNVLNIHNTIWIVVNMNFYVIFWSTTTDFSMKFTFNKTIWSTWLIRYQFEYMFWYVNEGASWESSEWTCENMDMFTLADQYQRQFTSSTIMNPFYAL